MEKNLEDECPICFEINAHNECILLDCCDKYIHKDCFDNWLKRNNNNKCIYCTQNNKYIDNFIQSHNSLSPEILVDISNHTILEPNNYVIVRTTRYIPCIYIFYMCICIIFLFAIFSGTGLWATLN